MNSRSIIFGLVAALLALFVLLPLGLLLPQAGAPGQALAQSAAAIDTVLLCLATLALALTLGIPLGVATARYQLPSWTTALILLPYAIPPYVMAVAWTQLANPTNGLLVEWLPLNIYTLAGMSWVLGLHFTPLVTLAVQDALGRIDPTLEEAARVSGAGPRQVFLRVTIPMVTPAVLAAAGFIISATAASFGVPYLLSAPASEPVEVLTTRIYRALELSPASGRPVAVSLALGLLVIGVGGPALLRLWHGRRTYAAARVNRKAPARRSRWVGAAILSYVALAALLPLASIAATSVMRRFGGGLGPDNLTLDTWTAVLANDRTWDALTRSLWLATAVASVIVAVGGFIAYSAERSRGWPARSLATLARVPYAIPGTVLALALILAFSQQVRLILFERVSFVLALADTAWLLGIAYAVKFLALPVDGARAGLRSIHPSLEEAARIAGAPWYTSLARVTVPLLAPALWSAWLLVFLPSFAEVTMSVLLRGPRTEVVGTLLFYLQSYADPQSAAVLAMLVLVVVLAGMLVAKRRPQ